MSKILWLTWKDYLHPEAGGAEVVLRELSQRLIAEGHEVTWLTCGYPGATARERLHGVDIIRIGRNRYLHSLQALNHYVRHLRNTFDVVIEVVNTAPYFGVFFGRKSRRFLFYHQLAREIWFYETKWPLNQFGYSLLEPVATRMLAGARTPVITISESTRADLARYGFVPGRTHVISEGIEIEPAADLALIQKFAHPTILSLGAVRAMKRTLDQVEAFEIAKQRIKDLQLKIAGSAESAYGKRVLARIAASPFAKDIQYLGRVSKADKIKLMQQCHMTLQTALKEGWGLTITEAASQGTPAIAYDVDGLRDSVRHNQTGLITLESPHALADAVTRVFTDPDLYAHLRRAAWDWSRQITFAQSYQDFKQALELT